MLRCLACACVCVLCAAPNASAYFESSAVGARAMGLADNFVSVADDASALYWNPAGLVRLSQHEALFTIEHSPELEDLQRAFAAVALHTPHATFGVGWHAVHLEDALREDLIYLSASRLLIRRALGAFIAGGATLKIAHVGVDANAGAGIDGLSTSATRVTADVGALLAPIPNVTVGVNARNLGRPRFDLLPGGASTEMGYELEWGLSFRWREDAQLHWSRVAHARRSTENKLGVELDVGTHVSMQLGVARDRVTGGVGVRWHSWRFDTAFRAHDVLGLLTRIGVRFGFGPTRRSVGDVYDDF